MRGKGKGKGKAIPQSPLGSQPYEDMVFFQDAMLMRASALEKTTEASKEKVRMEKIGKYMQISDEKAHMFTNCGSFRKLVPVFSVKERCIR